MIFKFKNNHVAACGQPPQYETNVWRCEVAENCYGEQILLAQHRQSKHFQFHHGDAGWEGVFTTDNPCVLSRDEVNIISKFIAGTP